LVSKLVTIVTNNFWSLQLVTDETFFCSDLVKSMIRFFNIKKIKLNQIDSFMMNVNFCDFLICNS